MKKELVKALEKSGTVNVKGLQKSIIKKNAILDGNKSVKK
ncbi:MAG: hypothetical protein ACI9DK_003023 [Vicingaceae bacterium]|jgi:hypothetical protein